MSQVKMLENVNKTKLQAAIESRGYTMSNVSRKLGYKPDYLTTSANRRKISVAVSIMLDNMYGIKPQEYVDSNRTEKPKAKDPSIPTETTVTGPITITGPVIIQFSDEQWSKIETLFKEVISNTVKESTKEAFNNL